MLLLGLLPRQESRSTVAYMRKSQNYLSSRGLKDSPSGEFSPLPDAMHVVLSPDRPDGSVSWRVMVRSSREVCW